MDSQCIPMHGSLKRRIQAWYSSPSISWTWVVPSLWPCFTLMPHFLEPVWHIIQYIVSNYLHYCNYCNYCYYCHYWYNIVQCVCWICTRMSELGQEIGYLLGGCQYTTKSGISVLRKDLSPPLLERFDCTTIELWYNSCAARQICEVFVWVSWFPVLWPRSSTLACW